jgi:hypothetical protein
MNTENHGVGGSYVIGGDGDRVLAERTKEHHELEQAATQSPPKEAVEALIPEVTEAQTRNGNNKKNPPSQNHQE